MDRLQIPLPVYELVPLPVYGQIPVPVYGLVTLPVHTLVPVPVHGLVPLPIHGPVPLGGIILIVSIITMEMRLLVACSSFNFSLMCTTSFPGSFLPFIWFDKEKLHGDPPMVTLLRPPRLNEAAVLTR